MQDEFHALVLCRYLCQSRAGYDASFVALMGTHAHPTLQYIYSACPAEKGQDVLPAILLSLASSTLSPMPEKMYDHDVFAVMTACDLKNRASSAFKLPHNSRWFRSATGGVADKPTMSSREATPAEDPPSEDEHVDRLVVTFDELLKDCPDGLRFGTNPSSSHILLGHRGTKGISAKQYHIAVDDSLSIFLHDYHSTHGTAVGYDGQNKEEVRKKETWILAYKPGTESQLGAISIYSGGLAIDVAFPNHAAADPRYMHQLRALVNTGTGAAPPIGVLGLDSEVTTQAPSGAQSPGERLIYNKDQRLGKGAFGDVHGAIRAQDGNFFAVKTFQPPANKRKRGDIEAAWLKNIRREFTIMKDHPHVSTRHVLSAAAMILKVEQPNVMQVFEFRENLEPMIIMAYYEAGNMANACLDGDEDYVSAFGQILDGLTHLHAKGVVHRDLKPENFLVERKPFKVIITDFGLSQVVSKDMLLTTFCGTQKYIAPEVSPMGDGHGTPADIWSLAVIAMEWMYDLPALPTCFPQGVEPKRVPAYEWDRWVRLWSNALLKRLLWMDGIAVDILLNMIRVKSWQRWNARQCLKRGFKVGLFKRRAVDGLIISSRDADEIVPQTHERDDGDKTPTAVSPPAPIDSQATFVLGPLWSRH